ncbi:MAG: hypothetical protein J5I50_09815 [Chitinophagaceae bacterium]|nr:hypothetical protein [Chitinophagaceae bacterium]
MRIVANETNHAYEIGQEVEILEIMTKSGVYKGDGNKRRYFICNEAEWLRRPSEQNKWHDLQAKVDGWYKDNIYPLAQRLCKADEGNQESNFGQMLELLNDLADEINRDPVTTIRKLVELAELRRNK